MPQAVRKLIIFVNNEHTQRVMHTQGQQDVGPRLGSCNANYQHTVLAVAMQISAHTANYAYPKPQQIVGPCLDYCNASYAHTQRIMHAQCQQVVGFVLAVALPRSCAV